MATEQASRMLKTYRRKLNGSKEMVDLDDLEDEITVMLKVIQERKDRTQQGNEIPKRRLKAKAATENDVDQMTVLMGKSSIAVEPVVITINEEAGNDMVSKA